MYNKEINPSTYTFIASRIVTIFRVNTDFIDIISTTKYFFTLFFLVGKIVVKVFPYVIQFKNYTVNLTPTGQGYLYLLIFPALCVLKHCCLCTWLGCCKYLTVLVGQILFNPAAHCGFSCRLVCHVLIY